MKNTLLTALAAAIILHRLTGWTPGLIVIPLFAAVAYLFVSTWGDGARAMRICAEDTDDR